jgi:hypothetical protein
LELRSSTMAVALLCVAACAEMSGDDRPHRECWRKAVERTMETKIDRSAPARGHAARKKPASATPDTASGSGCECEPEPPAWDGTGRAEAVRGT